MPSKPVASLAAELRSIGQALESLVLESQSTTPAFASDAPPSSGFDGRVLLRSVDGDHQYRFRPEANVLLAHSVSTEKDGSTAFSVRILGGSSTPPASIANSLGSFGVRLRIWLTEGSRRPRLDGPSQARSGVQEALSAGSAEDVGYGGGEQIAVLAVAEHYPEARSRLHAPPCFPEMDVGEQGEGAAPGCRLVARVDLPQIEGPASKGRGDVVAATQSSLQYVSSSAERVPAEDLLVEQRNRVADVSPCGGAARVLARMILGVRSVSRQFRIEGLASAVGVGRREASHKREKKWIVSGVARI